VINCLLLPPLPDFCEEQDSQSRVHDAGVKLETTLALDIDWLMIRSCS
jgi:hypothetical protein